MDNQVSFYRPKLLLSACFQEPTRYDGGQIKDPLVERIKKFVDPLYFCPEVALGLGVPRPRIVIHRIGTKKALIQPETGKDLTQEMEALADKFFSQLEEIDGAILKSKSPSCGVGSAKEFEGERFLRKTDGFFAESFKHYRPLLPLEDEGRLRDKTIYYHFLMRIFALAELREFLKNPNPQGLVKFHTKYKFILLTCHQELTRQLGALVASVHIPFEEKLRQYKTNFLLALSHKPSRARHANTLYHIAGFFTRRINPRERNHLLQIIERFRSGRVELRLPLELLRGLAFRFEEEYLISQRYLQPFPEELF